MLSTTINVAKSAQIYPKLPKSLQKQLAGGTLKYYQKLKFWSFSKKKLYVEEAPKHMLIVWFFNVRIYHMPFYRLKWPFYVNSSIPLCTK
jgi:hypothetical protein